ncbi:MAG TPA: hypothetical protein VK416_01790, partial [Thermoanaerobaculia bacterium]|nr:hypothetical protein [Thermoanaerobaculia bacterium]
MGICEIEEIASPQDGQNRAFSGAWLEHVGQRIKPENPIEQVLSYPSQSGCEPPAHASVDDGGGLALVNGSVAGA